MYRRREVEKKLMGRTHACMQGRPVFEQVPNVEEMIGPIPAEGEPVAESHRKSQVKRTSEYHQQNNQDKCLLSTHPKGCGYQTFERAYAKFHHTITRETLATD